VSDDDAEMRVAYAVRFEGLRAEDVPALDAKMAEATTAIDPLVQLTRGEVVPKRSNPYPSAGFLHGGEMRAGMVETHAFDLDEDAQRVRAMGRRIAEWLGGQSGMTRPPDRNWQASVLVKEGGYTYYVEVSGGYK
jgi:hypothetical protein